VVRPVVAVLKEEPMRRMVPLVAILWMLASAEPASAGGSTLDMIGGSRVTIGDWNLSYASAGSSITMHGTFTPGQQAPVSEGPWYAYVSPQTGNGQPILVGSVGIRGDGFPYVADVTFDVPSVEAGQYWVLVCDQGCKQGVGDLGGTSVVLAPTETEARAFARALILGWIHDQDVHVIESLRNQHEALQAQRDAATDAARDAETQSEEATDRAEAASIQAAAAQASQAEAEHQRDLWRLVGTIAVVAAVVAVIWGLVLLRRVRRLMPESPAELAPYPAKEPSGASTKARN
jgi:hypothetical protein